MRSPVLRRAAAVGCLAGLLLTVLVTGTAAAAGRTPGAATPRPAAPGPPGTAVSTFGSCVNNARSGDVLLLIDESSSLRTSDPDNGRVTAAKFLLDRLSRYADTARVRLDVSVAGFSDGYTREIDWTQLTAGSVDGLNRGLDAFGTRNGGYETDYWTALENARRDLGDRAAAQPSAQQRCQSIAWFSDGKLDITPRSTDADRAEHGTGKPFVPGPIDSQAAADRAIAAAGTALCAPRTGLADQLRSSGITMFAVGLNAGSSRPQDFDLMRSIATGEPSGAVRGCGQPPNRRPGEFTLASDIDDLLFAFDQFATPGQPPLQNQQGICQGPDLRCADRHPFVLDPSIETVQILGSVDADNIQAALISPSGARIPLPDKTLGRRVQVGAGSVQIAYSWLSARTVSIDMTTSDPTAGWPGEWALVFVDPTAASPDGQSRSDIHITGDLLPAWPSRPVLHSGDRLDGVRFGLVDGAGRPVAPGTILGDLGFSAVLLRPGAPDVRLVSGLDKNALGAPATVDLTGVDPGPATLRLTLDVRTAPARRADGSPAPGTVLAPRSVDLPLQVAAPVGFPEVAESVDFGKLDRVTSADGELNVTGPGCVWVERQDDPPLSAVPQDAGRVTVTAPGHTGPSNCLSVPDGESAALPLLLETAQPGNGTLTGQLTVLVAPPDDPGRAQRVTVEFTADLRQPIDPPTFWLTLVALLLAGPLIPLLLLYLARALTARFPNSGVYSRLIAVRVPPPGGMVLRDGAPFALSDPDFPGSTYSALRGRRATLSGVDLRTRWLGSPFGPGYVVAGVRDRGRTRAASSSRPPTHRTDARLPLAVQNTWVVLHDTDGAADEAQVLVVLGQGAGPDVRDGLARDIGERLPSLLDRLREPGRGGRGPGTDRAAPPGPPGPPGPGPTPPTRPFSFDDVPTGDTTRPTWMTTPGDPR